jgi:hypothetical protein
MPLHGFTAVDLGYQRGDAVSNLINKIDEAPLTTTYLQLFDQIWNDQEKLQDVTEAICTHIEAISSLPVFKQANCCIGALVAFERNVALRLIQAAHSLAIALWVSLFLS